VESLAHLEQGVKQLLQEVRLPRVPEFTRQIFASRQQPAQIQAAAAPFQAAADIAGTVSAVGQEIQRQRDVEQTASFNNFAQTRVAEAEADLRQDPEIQRNPALFRQRIKNVFQEVKNDPRFTSLSSPAKSATNIRLNSLATSTDIKGLDFEIAQNIDNANTTLQEGLDVANLRALTTEDEIEDVVETQANSIKGFTAAGTITQNEAVELLDNNIKSIYSQRAQKLINEDNTEEAKLFAEENKEELGVDGFQAVMDTVARKEDLRRKQAKKLDKLRLSDPWSYIEQVDSEPVPLINFNDAASISDNLDDRVEYVENKSKQYGTNLPILTNTERDAFIRSLENDNLDVITNSLNELAINITDEQQSLIAQDIFANKPAFGVAISIADEAPTLSSSIISGDRAMRDKIVTMPSENNMRNSFLDKAGKAISQPQFREAALNAIRSVYADKAVKNNINDTSIDENLIETSIEELFGDIIEVNDSEVVGFRRNDGSFIPEDDFQDLFEDLDEKQIFRAHGGDIPRIANGDPLDLDDLKQANLVVVGDGLYAINLFNEFAVNKNGDPFVLNLKKIHNE
jgi:hypothetical protein